MTSENILSKSVKQNVKERISVETKDENKIKILSMRFLFIVSKLKQLDNIKQSSLIQSTNGFLTELFNFIILRQLNTRRETTDHGLSEKQQIMDCQRNLRTVSVQ